MTKILKLSRKEKNKRIRELREIISEIRKDPERKRQVREILISS